MQTTHGELCCPQTLAERLAQGLDVRLGNTVTRVEWDAEGAQVHCANGSCWEADAVVMTVSLGVLKVRQTHSQVYSQSLSFASVNLELHGFLTVRHVLLPGFLSVGLYHVMEGFY